MLNDWNDTSLSVRHSYNVAPTTDIGVMLPDQNNGDMHWHAMRWGMVPSWSKEFGSKYATFNARAETVAEKPTFKNAWSKSRRCLIPMAGYYEWQASNSSQDATTAKQPYYISDPHLGVMLAAGLYEPWGDAGQYSCTILTKPASEPLSGLHSRMPLLLTPASYDVWLNASTQELDEWWPSSPDPELIYWPVSRAVGNVRNNDERLIEPIDV